jgi:anti-sigma factor ChrR (cupin superfamily)
VQRQSPDGLLKNPELSVSAGSGAMRASRNRSDASVLSPDRRRLCSGSSAHDSAAADETLQLPNPAVVARAITPASCVVGAPDSRSLIPSALQRT